MCRARHAASSRSFIVVISSSPTTTLPDVAWSIPATRFSKVVFPDPEGPMIATNPCVGIVRETSSRARTYRRDAFERSEEHTSELQSRPHLVCRLLLETK